MDEWESVMEEARQFYFEKQDYRAAHDLVWDRVLEFAPNAQAPIFLIMSLRRLEYQEMLTMLRKHPDALDLKKGIAEAWVDRHSWEAVDLCTEILGAEDLSPRDEIDVRWTRIRATSRQRAHLEWRYSSLAQDFIVLWGIGDAKGGLMIPFTRRRLLETVAQIFSPSAVKALQELSSEARLSPDTRQFIEQKILELTVLGELTNERDQSPAE